MTSDSGAERKFWQIALADLERQIGAGRNGLSSAEAAARRFRYGPNTLEERRRLSLPLRGPRTDAAGLTCTIWPVTSQSNRWRIAASRCLTLDAASLRIIHHRLRRGDPGMPFILQE